LVVEETIPQLIAVSEGYLLVFERQKTHQITIGAANLAQSTGDDAATTTNTTNTPATATAVKQEK